MELKDVIEHKVLSVYEKEYLSCVKDPKERMKLLLGFYQKAAISLELLKIERDSKRNSDLSYFMCHYFPLFDLKIMDLEGFSKLILGENVSKILIKRKEIEECIKEVDEDGTTYENRQLYFNAYSNELCVPSIISQNDILRLIKDRKLLLFGNPISEVVGKKASLKYSHSDTNNIFRLRENENEKDSFLFKSYDLDYFRKYYKDIVGLLRHSLSDDEIDMAKDKLREMDFGKLEEDYRRSKENYFKQEMLYDGLEREASFYKNHKELGKRL